MASMLVRIRASSLALRPLRPLASNRSFCDKNNDDGAGSPPEEKKLSLDELLQLTKIQKPVKPIKLNAIKPRRSELPEVPDLDKKTIRAAESAAKTLPGDVQKNLDDLLGQLKDVSNESRNTVEDLIVAMKIDRATGEPSATYPGKKKIDIDGVMDRAFNQPTERWKHGARQRQPEERSIISVPHCPLFTGPRLNIFSADQQKTPAGSLSFWDQLEEREVKHTSKVAPRNGFEELIEWTEQGKLWPFPIDNEYGMTKEANVSFEDHVFLDHLIEDENAFPDGPVKQFMELVCVGLSKNPYISVERKHNCIEWYRDYFTSKKKLIAAAIEK